MEPNTIIDSETSFGDASTFLNALAKDRPDVFVKLQSELRLSFPPSSCIGAEVEVELNPEDDQKDLYATKSIKLGYNPIGRQLRLHDHSLTDVRTEMRSGREYVFVSITHPGIVSFLSSAVECAQYACTAAVITAACTGAIAAAYALFYPAWKVCMLTKVAEDIVFNCSLSLYTKGKWGCWDYHNSPSCRF